MSHWVKLALDDFVSLTKSYIRDDDDDGFLPLEVCREYSMRY